MHVAQKCQRFWVNDMHQETTPSDGVDAGLAGADAYDLLDVGHEYLAVADAAGLRRLADRLDGAFDGFVAEHNLDLHLGQEVDDVLGAAIELGVAFLAAEALGL